MNLEMKSNICRQKYFFLKRKRKGRTKEENYIETPYPQYNNQHKNQNKTFEWF